MFECVRYITEQLVAWAVRTGAAHGPLGQHGAHVVVRPHLAPALHVHGALQGDAQASAAADYYAHYYLHVLACTKVGCQIMATRTIHPRELYYMPIMSQPASLISRIALKSLH